MGQDGLGSLPPLPPGAVLAPSLPVGGRSRQQNLQGSCTPTGAGWQRGLREDDMGQEDGGSWSQRNSCSHFPTGKGFLSAHWCWIPWCRRRFPFLSAGLLGLQMPVLPGCALVFHLGILPKKSREDCGCWSRPSAFLVCRAAQLELGSGGEAAGCLSPWSTAGEPARHTGTAEERGEWRRPWAGTCLKPGAEPGTAWAQPGGLPGAGSLQGSAEGCEAVGRQGGEWEP